MSDGFDVEKHGKDSAMLLTPELVTIISVWCGGVVVEEIDPFTDERLPALNVQCGEDVKRASLGDWVVKKEDRTFDVMKPNEYKQHFENA